LLDFNLTFKEINHKQTNMRKFTINALASLIMIISLNSCATVFGGRTTVAQKTKPLTGEPSRSIRPVAMIADILLFWPGLIVDFATGAIYRPEGNGTKTVEPKQDIKNQKSK
jgi:hypothetical protein